MVAGSGLAGLTAACDLADAGVSVTLLESRARLGGATFSFQRGGMTVDNGQHVVLRCCTAYLRLLERLGSSAGMAVQERFRVPVLAPGGRFTELRRIDVPAPLHLLPAIARYRALRPIDRARVLRAALALRSLDPDDESLDSHNFGDWLARHGQNDETRDRLWNLITVAALNGHVSQVSLASAAKVFGTELATEAYRLLMEVLGTAATVRQGSPGALLRGRVERMHRACLILTFGGGTNEVQRDIIGMVALGLPRNR